MQDRWLALKPLVAVRVALSAALVVGLVACQGAGSSSHFFASLGTTTSEVNLLILVAQEQGYFASNGLQIVHQTYPSGRAAVGALMDHEVDLVTGSEFAFAGQVLMHEDIGILAAINRSSLEYLVARLESGINDIDDLKGKTIGVPLGSRPEFALHRYLYLHGIDVSDLALVDVPVEQAVDALTSGKVDAVAAWQPYIDEATEELDGRVISWSVQEDQPSYSLLMSRGKWAAENPELITRLLRSLVQAEEHVTQNPGAAISLLEER